MRIAGQTPDAVYVEICEIPDHPWFLGCQFHPEFKSKPLEPHPLFAAFIGAAYEHRRSRAQIRAAHAIRAVHARRLSSLPPIGRGQPLVLIAGPCVIESEEHVHFLAAEIRKIAGPFVFKASFDKANRSSVASYRGPGLKEGVRILAGLRREGYRGAHRHSRAVRRPKRRPRAPTFCRSPRFFAARPILLIAAGRTGRVVNIKKGQFVSPHDIRNAAEKVASTGNNNILLTERGSSFGYNNLVVDMRGLPIMRDFGWPVIFDATHSVQIPGGLGHASGGQPEFIPVLARAAVAAGVDGVFLEVHEDPERALSDGPNALRLDRLPALWDKLQALHRLSE